MCRLLGIVGAPPLPIKEAVDAFIRLAPTGATLPGHARGYLDGWGFSGFSKARAVYFDRQALSVSSEPERVPSAVERAASSGTPVFIGHLRHKSMGERSLGNTHPFHYRDWVLAHDGTIFDPKRLDIADYQTQGETDSERFMVWLVDQVGSAPDSLQAMVETLSTVREKIHFDSLTFLLSDGNVLWAYRETTSEQLEPGISAADRQKYYTLYWARVGNASVICSEPLAALDPTWTLLPERTIAMFTPDKPSPVLTPLP